MKLIKVPEALYSKTNLSLKVSDLKDFQGDLKDIGDEELQKLKHLIVTKGFVVPPFVWLDSDGVYNLIDGHQRKAALMSLMGDGYIIPEIPVFELVAESIEDARELLLSVTSQFGEFDHGELENWLDEVSSDMSDSLRFVDTEISFDLPSLDLRDEEETDDSTPKTTECPSCGHVW